MGKIAGIPDSGTEKMRAAVYYDKHDVRIEGVADIRRSMLKLILRALQRSVVRNSRTTKYSSRWLSMYVSDDLVELLANAAYVRGMQPPMMQADAKADLYLSICGTDLHEWHDGGSYESSHKYVWLRKSPQPTFIRNKGVPILFQASHSLL